MREIAINSLKVGDTLPSSIYCKHAYNVLIVKGTILTEELLKRINKIYPQGSCLFLDDNDVGGLGMELLVRVANPKIKKAYLDTFVVGKSIFENMVQGNPLNIKMACEAVDLLVGQILENEQILLQMAAIKVIDEYTFSHMVNSALYAAAFGKSLGLSIGEIYDLCLAGLLHDIGKAKVSLKILRKPGELTADEFKEMQKHSQLGYEELKKYPEMNERVRQAVLQHHERGDGSGYPQKLHRSQISLFSSIIAIVDIYDALTSKRCYRGRILPHESVEILMSECSLNRLDAELVRVFLTKIALYPVGLEVVLDNGARARVSRLNENFPLRPELEIINLDHDGIWQSAGELNLLDHPTLFIAQILM